MWIDFYLSTTDKRPLMNEYAINEGWEQELVIEVIYTYYNSLKRSSDVQQLLLVNPQQCICHHTQ